MRHRLAAIFLVLLLGAPAHAAPAPPPAAQPSSPPTLFTFDTDEFWLNLHHFLYVLGRAEARLPDATNPAVAGAQPDAERGVRSLMQDERQAWAAAIRDYATRLSLQSNLDPVMVQVTRALADADDAPTLSGAKLDAGLAATLERAAPIYRKAWWPSHLSANRMRKAALEDVIARHGAATIDYVSKIYGQAWPAAGFPVHMSGYANFGGAYSVGGGPSFVVFSSMTNQNSGLHGFEIVVHEGMHRWDQVLFSQLAAQARSRNLLVPRDLTHAMIFFTAGEAVRRIDASYVPYADAFGVWSLPLSGATLPAARLKPILEGVWRPYMKGRGTRDEALGVLIERAAALSK
jgi:hypothetical protein